MLPLNWAVTDEVTASLWPPAMVLSEDALSSEQAANSARDAVIMRKREVFMVKSSLEFA